MPRCRMILCDWHESVIAGLYSDPNIGDDPETVCADVAASFARSCEDCES